MSDVALKSGWLPVVVAKATARRESWLGDPEREAFAQSAHAALAQVVADRPLTEALVIVDDGAGMKLEAVSLPGELPVKEGPIADAHFAVFGDE